MKQLLMVSILFVLSCQNIQTDKVKAFIPGTYFKEVSNEYSRGYDTLVITPLNDNVYTITRYSSFNRIREGSIMPLQRQSEIWTALYNKDEQVLNETKKGKVLSFFPGKNTLMVGSSEFKKVKN